MWFSFRKDFPPVGMWGRPTPKAGMGGRWHLRREYEKSLLPTLDWEGCQVDVRKNHPLGS